jgi:hypothetical protein
MLTESFYTALAAALGEAGRRAPFWVAVGAGREAWDRAGLPPVSGEVGRLEDEVTRRPVERIAYVDEGGARAERATPRLRLTVVFQPGEATGPLRECGLFGGDAGESPGSGMLLSYFAHARLDKDERMSLSRTFTIDLTPRAVTAGSQETRWLANTESGEVHDVENRTRACQLDEIRFDRRFWFPTLELALETGYDRCAYCFGRELSLR